MQQSKILDQVTQRYEEQRQIEVGQKLFEFTRSLDSTVNKVSIQGLCFGDNEVLFLIKPKKEKIAN